MLKLYLAAHDGAVKAIGLKTKPEIDAVKTEAFKAAGYDKRVDFGPFSMFFDDELLKLQSLATRKTPSEIAAEPHA